MAGSLLTAVARTRVVLQRRRADGQASSPNNRADSRAETGTDRAATGADSRAEMGADSRAETGADSRAETGADSRAPTEPRLARGTTPPPHDVSEPTSPFPRDFDPVNEGRDSVPYLDLQISAMDGGSADPAAEGTGPPVVRAEGTGTAPRYVRTISRKVQVLVPAAPLRAPAARVETIVRAASLRAPAARVEVPATQTRPVPAAPSSDADIETDSHERVTNELDTSLVERVVREIETEEQNAIASAESQRAVAQTPLAAAAQPQRATAAQPQRATAAQPPRALAQPPRENAAQPPRALAQPPRALADVTAEPQGDWTLTIAEPQIRDSDADIEPHLVARSIAGDRETRELRRIETDVVAGDIDTRVRSRPPADDLELSTEQVERVLETFDEPEAPQLRLSHSSWLGVVLSPPEVGAALVIGTWLRPEFCVTSPVMQIAERPEGVLVQTVTSSRYFVKHGGDTYLVRRGHGA